MSKYTKVVIHPLVLLSIADQRQHYPGSHSRVSGALLGYVEKDAVHVTSSFALPFDEDSSRSGVWYLDTDFFKQMYRMQRRVSANEVILGWYTTGKEGSSRIQNNDLAIHNLWKQFNPDPLYCVVETVNNQNDFPVTAYYSKISTENTAKELRETFITLPCEIAANEAEEIGVEHLLKDIKTSTKNPITKVAKRQVKALNTLKIHVDTIIEYLEQCARDNITPPLEISRHLQEAYDLISTVGLPEYQEATQVWNNDISVVSYVSTIGKITTQFGNLIDSNDILAK